MKEYNYLDSISDYQIEQKTAHQKNVSLGLLQLEKYLPQAAVDCLKEAREKETPCRFNMPKRMTMIGEHGLPKVYNKDQ